MTAKPPAYEAFLTTEEVVEDLKVKLRQFQKPDIDAWRAIDAVNLRVAGDLTKPFRDRHVLEAAARALGAPAA